MVSQVRLVRMGGLQGDLMNWPFVMVTSLHKIQALGNVFKEIGVLRLEFLQWESRDQR